MSDSSSSDSADASDSDQPTRPSRSSWFHPSLLHSATDSTEGQHEFAESNRIKHCADCDRVILGPLECRACVPNLVSRAGLLRRYDPELEPLSSEMRTPFKRKAARLPSQLFRSRSKANHAIRSLFDNRPEAKKTDSNASIIAAPPQGHNGPRKRRKGHFRKLLGNLLGDWMFLALLGCGMALCSIAMDEAIHRIAKWHFEFLKGIELKTSGLVQSLSTFLIWVLYAVVLVTSSALFAHYVAPQAIGSGIPEMKTILRGVVLKEYLSFRTLVSKMVGLTLSLGSGMPIGKEGPFVHVASVVANLLSRLVHSFDSVYVNESRHTEMLAAGCAVGVACVFSAPVGGVLFSIEVTSVYFAVRNYWRGFFAAACAATVFRLTKVFIQTDDGLIAFYQTSFPNEAFYPEEMPIFAFIGLVCGIASAGFIALHRWIVMFLRRNKVMKAVFQKNWLIYPIVVSFFVSSLTYPDGFGKYLGGYNKFSNSARYFFMNCTFMAQVNDSQYCMDELDGWLGPDHSRSVFLVLSCFMVTFFLLSALSSTLPIPSGSFGPSFTIGAAFGRFVGELMAIWKPQGFRMTAGHLVYPGGYAVVGAAAFSGGVTHTISVAVIMFELTGQLVYILPVMIAVLIANAVCSYLQPSIYDSIIKIKHLPYLPDIPHSSSKFHGIHVEQFMTGTGRVHFLSRDSTYADVQEILVNEPRLKAFPIVENRQNMILIGSCSRSRLLRSLDSRVGQSARQAEAMRQITENIQDINRRFQTVRRQRDSITTDSNTLDEKPTLSDQPTVTPLDFFYQDHPNANNLDVIEEQPAQTMRHSATTPNLSANDFSVRKVAFAAPQTSRPSRFTVTSVQVEDGDAEAVSVAERRSANDTHTKSNRSLTVSNVTHEFQNTVGELFRTLTRLSFTRRRKQSRDSEYDLHGDEKKRWEEAQLAQPVDWHEVGVDPAPFQLVEHSSLLKVHSLFSLLGLSRAYVTKCGRLVGVVALRDIRIAIENVQSGQLGLSTPSIHPIEHSAQPGQAKAGFLQKLRNSIVDLNPKANPDEDEETDDEDARNDQLNPPLEVVENTVRPEDWLKHKSVSSESLKRTIEHNLKVSKGLSLGSDPCLAGAPTGLHKRNFSNRRSQSIATNSLNHPGLNGVCSQSGSSTSSSPPLILMTPPSPQLHTDSTQESDFDFNHTEDNSSDVSKGSDHQPSSSTVTVGRKHNQINM